MPWRTLGFMKSTLVGGIFVLVPLVLLSLAIGHAVHVAYAIVQPLLQWLPIKSVGSVSLAFLVGIAAVVISCFFAGLVARTAFSQWLVGSIEQLILNFVPGYGLMKSTGQGWIGIEADGPHQPVLVRLGDAAQFGFVMDTLHDSRRVVFIPDVPTPWSGTLLIVNAELLEPLSISTKHTIECLRKLGANTSKLLATTRPA
jgi:uncharacterized membrane protein